MLSTTTCKLLTLAMDRIGLWRHLGSVMVLILNEPLMEIGTTDPAKDNNWV